MINPATIKEKANNLYRYFLMSLIDNDDSFFPCDKFPIGKPPKDNFEKFQSEIIDLKENSKSKRGFGYIVEWETCKTRKWGNQSIPTRIVIETELDYLKLINKEREVKRFRENLTLILSSFPCLKTWLSQKPLEIIKHQDQWEDLLKVCQYFQQKPKPNLYIRELPISVHTKFIEQNQGILSKLLAELLPPEAINQEETEFEKRFYLKWKEPLIRLRFLDENLQKLSHFPVKDFTIPLSEFKQLNFNHCSCFMTENLMNFLTFPPVINSLVIFGGGRGLGSLKEVSWLKTCQIYYWGDLDADGFQILSQSRTYFPHTISIMMDEKTYQTFAEFSVSNPKASYRELPNLTLEENQLYTYLCQKKIRLEQERIHQIYVNQAINMIQNQLVTY